MYLLFVLVLFGSGFSETGVVMFPDRESCEAAQQEFVAKMPTMSFTALDSVTDYASVCVPIRHQMKKV